MRRLHKRSSPHHPLWLWRKGHATGGASPSAASRTRSPPSTSEPEAQDAASRSRPCGRCHAEAALRSPPSRKPLTSSSTSTATTHGADLLTAKHLNPRVHIVAAAMKPRTPLIHQSGADGWWPHRRRAHAGHRHPLAFAPASWTTSSPMAAARPRRASGNRGRSRSHRRRAALSPGGCSSAPTTRAVPHLDRLENLPHCR